MATQIIENQNIKGEITGNLTAGIRVQGDNFILRMVINNLIENAFKYSNDQPIEVNLFERNNQKIIEVKDQGIGIPKEEYKNIFKKFYRIQEEETRTTKGTGLGLFIVKEAIERHNGSVWVGVNDPKGTIFRVILS